MENGQIGNYNGRKEIENQHAYPFTTVSKEARLDVKSYRSKWITDGIVSVDIKWESSGHKTLEGKPLPTIRYASQSYCKEGKERGRCYYNIENNYWP
jgi:hypothetical protein